MSLTSPPRLHNAAHDEERRVTWLELFYDLVYVATLIQLGNSLSEDISLAGFVRFVIVFAPIWWAWTGMTFYLNRFVVDDLWHRLLIYLQIVAIFFLGISLEGAFGDLKAQFVLAYAAVRLVQVILYVRTWEHEPATRPLTQRYVASYLVGIAIWVVSAFLPMPYAAELWLLGLGIEIGTAVAPGTRALVSALPPDVSHMRERYGIFVIIMLGESFIKTITYAAGTPVTLEILTFSLVGVFVVFGMWWLYFHDFEETTIREGSLPAFAWVYAHLPLTLGMTAFGVATKKFFQGLGEGHLDPDYVLLLCGALALYALAVALIEASTDQSDPRKQDRYRVTSRLGIAAAAGCLAFFGRDLAPPLLMAIVATVFLLVILSDVWPSLTNRVEPAQSEGH
jgi:low temperature requirement protein LtrA